VCPLTSIGNYKPKHNPMVFFDDVTNTNDPKAPRCLAHVRPLGELEADLADPTKTARYNFITPDQCGDMHSACATDSGITDPIRLEVIQGDRWLSTWIPRILASDAYKQGGALLITWDEAESHAPDCITANCPIGMLALSPFAKGNGYLSPVKMDHTSTLHSVQTIFGVTPLLGPTADAGTAGDLSDLFSSFP
jgi:predicted hotdog family 3-hydroxylacyl-ACP dehydratase